jgi:hypothetical protein
MSTPWMIFVKMPAKFIFLARCSRILLADNLRIYYHGHVEKSVGFKEWQVVCDALASGRQTVIMRKGGIHEGREGFSFAHENFFLFPTRFHATGEQVKSVESVTVLPEWHTGENVAITHYCEAAWARTLTDWDEVLAWAPHHIYSDQTVRDRFDWEGKGMSSGSIHIAKVRVSRLHTPWIFPYEARYGGCRSWVSLDEPPTNWRELLAICSPTVISLT